jgi:hypothetical protein
MASALNQVQPDVQDGIADIASEFYQGRQVPVGDD